jgi:hypothetical protein
MKGSGRDRGLNPGPPEYEAGGTRLFKEQILRRIRDKRKIGFN